MTRILAIKTDEPGYGLVMWGCIAFGIVGLVLVFWMARAIDKRDARKRAESESGQA